MDLLTFVWNCFQDRNFHWVVFGLYEQYIVGKSFPHSQKGLASIYTDLLTATSMESWTKPHQDKPPQTKPHQDKAPLRQKPTMYQLS